MPAIDAVNNKNPVCYSPSPNSGVGKQAAGPATPGSANPNHSLLTVDATVTKASDLNSTLSTAVDQVYGAKSSAASKIDTTLTGDVEDSNVYDAKSSAASTINTTLTGDVEALTGDVESSNVYGAKSDFVTTHSSFTATGSAA